MLYRSGPLTPGLGQFSYVWQVVPTYPLPTQSPNTLGIALSALQIQALVGRPGQVACSPLPYSRRHGW